MHFFASTIDYLGHVIRLCQLEIAFSTADAIKHLLQLRNITVLHSFLKLCIVFRIFILNLARIAALLNRKLQKDQLEKFGLVNEKELTAMAAFLDKLISSPILALSHARGHHRLDIKACSVQAACVLLQQQPNSTKGPIDNWYPSLTKAEHAYNTSEKSA